MAASAVLGHVSKVITLDIEPQTKLELDAKIALTTSVIDHPENILIQGEYFRERDVMSIVRDPSRPKQPGPLGDIVSRIQSVAARAFDGNSDQTMLEAFTAFIDRLKTSKETELFFACPKSGRLIELSSLTKWADGFRVFAVDKTTNQASVHFFAPKYNSSQKITEVVIHEQKLGSAQDLYATLDLSNIRADVIKLDRDQPVRVEIDQSYFNEDQTLCLDPYFCHGDHVSIYHGSIPVLVHRDLLVPVGAKIGDGMIRISQAKPTVLGGFSQEKGALARLQEIIADRIAVPVTGSAMTLKDYQAEADFGAFSNKTHVANSIGVARALFEKYKEFFELEGREIVVLTGSLVYHDVLPSFDVIVAKEFQRLVSLYIKECKAENKPTPIHKHAVINISDRNSRNRDGRGWQMPEGSGLDFVANVHEHDISNNAKEMLIMGTSSGMVIALGGGPTVMRNLIRAKALGLKVVSLAYSNSKVGVSGATQVMGKFETIAKEVIDELHAEKSKGALSNLPADKAIGLTSSEITIIEGYPHSIAHQVDIADPATAIARDGLVFSKFPSEEAISDFVEHALLSALAFGFKG